MAGRVSVLAVEDSHAEILADFFRRTWDSSATAERVLSGRHNAAAQNCSEPGTVPPAYIAVQEEKVIGYCGSLPLRLWHAGTVHRAYWAKGLMVLPEFRGGPIGYHVLNALTKSRPLMAAMVVAEDAKRLFGALGYQDHGSFPNLIRQTRFRLALTQIRPLDLPASKWPVRLAVRAAEAARLAGLPLLGGGLADALTRPVWRPRPAKGTSVTIEPSVAKEQMDRLWEATRDDLGALSARDHLAWSKRYSGASHGLYHFICLWRDDRLVGVAVLRSPRKKADARLAGLRMASISDLLVHPSDPEIGLLLATCEDHAATLGAGAVILSISNRRVVEAARRRGYLERPGNLHLLLRASSRDYQWPPVLHDWWLTRGDSESDETF